LEAGRVERIGVAGAGTMGAGIAQVAALGGYVAYLHDPDAGALARGGERLRSDLVRGAERGRWTAAEAEAAATRVREARRLDDIADCELVIEAAPERLELKRSLFEHLERICGETAILASNTSSLSITAIAAAAARPGRIVGMHFFNPPALMKLVEIVAGERSEERYLATAEAVAERIGRTPVRCADSVGFIVNRCNRPFTLEALRILDEGGASHAEIDRSLRDAGYRMGPFEYMDLIGIDVNLEVARSFFDQRPEPRWRPHPIQERMVAEGRLGRKAGHGFYDYEAGRRVDPSDASELGEPEATAIRDRVVCQLVNEAAFASEEGIAAADDIDRAMRLGLNHPRGPFEWARELGPDRVLATLDALRGELGDERYAASSLLRRWGELGGPSPR
jgi:3-hydroxybutyryl-CoA dehydrogenase